MKKCIDGNPEFGYELVCTLPYAYYLHKNNMLGEIKTVKDMKPFYYFCDDVKETYDYRSVDNKISMKDCPNNWVAHNAKAITGKNYNELTEEEKSDVNGVLDYKEWLAPPIKDYYLQNNEIEIPGKFIMICNAFCVAHAEFPVGFLNISILQEIFSYLTDKGYTLIYKRPENTEFALDVNEQMTLNCDLFNKFGIKALDENNKIITDKDLCKLYKNIYLMDDLLKEYPHLSYNTFQLKLFSKAEGFISYGGGNSILCCFFNAPVISYVTGGPELRKNFFVNKDCFYKKMSPNVKLYPIKDAKEDILKRGYNDYSELLKIVKEVF